MAADYAKRVPGPAANDFAHLIFRDPGDCCFPLAPAMT